MISHLIRQRSRTTHLWSVLALVFLMALTVTAIKMAAIAPPSGVNSSSRATVSHGAYPGGRLGDPTTWSGAADGRVMPLEEARAKVSFRILMPTYLPEGAQPAEVYLRRSSSKKHPGRVELRYTTGLWINQEGRDSPMNEWGLADRLNDPKAGTPMEDHPTPWLKVTVNGIPAMAHTPGTITTDEGLVIPAIPGSVSWYKDGVEYQVFDVGGRTVDELIKVAESLN